MKRWQLIIFATAIVLSRSVAEPDDTSFIQILSRSHYLDYIRTHHGWFEDRMPTAKLYRVWTENDVIDVLSPDAPRVESQNAI